jgi:hypothetical protein
MPVVAQRVFTASGVVVLIGISFFLALQSPLNPLSIHYPDAESSLYLYAASQLLDGNMIYRDIFDFHGPLIFLIDAFGLFVGEVVGDVFGGAASGAASGMVGGATGLTSHEFSAGLIAVWLLEAIFLTVTLLTIFITLRRCTDPLSALFVCLVFASLVGYSLQGGNRVEEYALLLQALGLAGFVDYFLKRQFSVLGVYLIGTSAALMLCLKPLLTAFWLPFLIVVIVLLFRREGPAMAVVRLLALVFSIALVFVIVVPWLYVTNALASCLNQMGSFYEDALALVTPQERIDALYFFMGRAPFVLVVFISLAAVVKLTLLSRRAKITSEDGETVFRIKQVLSQEDAPFGRNTRALIVANLIAALICYTLMAVPGRPDEYLALQGLVCLVIPLAYVLHFFVRGIFKKEKLRIVFGAVVVVLLAVTVGVPGFATTATLVQRQGDETPKLIEQQELANAVLMLRAVEDSGDPLVVFGDECWVYPAVGSYSATRYAYQPFSATFRPDLNADFYRQIRIADANLLVGRLDEGRIEKYPGIDGYELVFKNRSYEVYRKLEPPADDAPADDAPADDAPANTESDDSAPTNAEPTNAEPTNAESPNDASANAELPSNAGQTGMGSIG